VMIAVCRFGSGIGMGRSLDKNDPPQRVAAWESPPDRH
jgi:hypothetical protein